MKRLLLPFALLLFAACASTPRSFSRTIHVAFDSTPSGALKLAHLAPVTSYGGAPAAGLTIPARATFAQRQMTLTFLSPLPADVRQIDVPAMVYLNDSATECSLVPGTYGLGLGASAVAESTLATAADRSGPAAITIPVNTTDAAAKPRRWRRKCVDCCSPPAG